LPSGTLVLLGGRRALVHPDGSLEVEKVPAPEPLCGLVEVPSGARTILVGHGAHGVYRLDDPLGAAVTLARSSEGVTSIGAGPSLVAVWTRGSDVPRFLDVATGAEHTLPGLPAPPMRALLFVDDRRGAAVFEAVGLAVTGDGGATWRLAGEAAPFDALRVSGLRRRGGVRAFADADGPDGAVDIDGARLGARETERPAATELPMLRWIRMTGRDPLEVAASSGFDLPTGGAVAVSHGLLARVDPRSGAVADLVEIARNAVEGSCGAGRAGQTAWVACGLREDADPRLFDPFGVMRLPLGAGALALGRPVLVRNGESELRVAPSGGAMLLESCKNDEPGSACVRQPDGRWKTIALDLADRGAGPLSDGRVAFLRGMFDGDKPPGKLGAPPPAAPPARDAQLERLHIAVAGPDGEERSLAPIAFTPVRGYVRVQSPIEEDPDHTLRFVIEDGDGPFAVALPPGHEVAQAHRVPDAAAARLRAGRGIAVGDGRVLASLDGGGTWSELPAPPSVIDAARSVAASYDDPDQLEVSEVGAKIGAMLRIGWGPEEAPTGDTNPRGVLAGPLLASRVGADGGPAQVLTCTSQGPVTGTAPLSAWAQAKDLFAVAAGRRVHAPEGAAPEHTPGVRREASGWWSGSEGMLDTIAWLDEEGPDGGGAAPQRWTLRWHDPTEIGGRVRSVSIPVPEGATFGTSLRFGAASGGHALFALRSGGKVRLVRIAPSGAVESAEVVGDLVPTGEVAFAEGRGGALAWIREALLIVWLPGEPPRAVARLGLHGLRIAGAPTPTGVPLLLGGSDWSLARTVPIPLLDRTSAALPPSLPLDGWTRLPSLPRRLDTLPACAPRAPGTRFVLARASLHAEIDGTAETATHALYDVRLDGSDACIAGVTAVLSPDRRSAPPAGGTAPQRAAEFVRADLAGKRAEGGERGVPPAGMKRMACALSARR